MRATPRQKSRKIPLVVRLIQTLGVKAPLFMQKFDELSTHLTITTRESTLPSVTSVLAGVKGLDSIAFDKSFIPCACKSKS